jgi:hypothetical protein
MEAVHILPAVVSPEPLLDSSGFLVKVSLQDTVSNLMHKFLTISLIETSSENGQDSVTGENT